VGDRAHRGVQRRRLRDRDHGRSRRGSWPSRSTIAIAFLFPKGAAIAYLVIAVLGIVRARGDVGVLPAQ
jgi:hypothetical protein